MNNRKFKIANDKLIVSFDPSSTIVGYAVFRMDRTLIEAGPITPANKSARPYDRIISLGDDVWSLLDQHNPHLVLFEWTVGKVGQRRHAGGGAGLSVYGCGVGWIGCTCRFWAGFGRRCQAVPIMENDWTRGVPKEARQIAVAQMYPQYNPADDPAADVADAIGMAVWWMREQLIYNL